MNFRNVILFAAFFTQVPAFAQPDIGHILSVGVTGGLGLTDAFSDRKVMGVDTDTHLFSGSKDYIVGPSLEVHLPLRLSVELDALYRPLHLTITNIVIPRPTPFTTSETRNSWEFPLLVKYRLSVPLVKPFLEAGPAFRTVASFPNDAPHLSAAGFAAGAGAELKLGPLRVGPEIRYIRWGSDSRTGLSSFGPQSNLNQAEFLLGISF